MKTRISVKCVSLLAVMLAAGCCGECQNKLPIPERVSEKTTILPDIALKPQVFVNIDETLCSVPDGLAVDANGDIILAAPNYIDYEKVGGAKLFKIDKNKNVTVWFADLPAHPVTKKVHPMGIEFGPDGNLYIADNQYFNNTDYKSRLLRVVLENGKPVRCEVAASGFKLANAVRWHKGKVYVSDTQFDMKDKLNQSGVYAISLDEMKKGEVKLLPDGKDPHKVAQFTAKDGTGADKRNDGADGVTFDSLGRMYCGLFGDGVISRITFDDNGKPMKQEIIVDDPSINCCDGIICDTKTDKIYITNSKRNTVHCYDVKKNSFGVISENDNTDGKDGLLDQPCEPLVIGNQLIIVNFDMAFPGMKNTKHDSPVGLSVITLPDN